MIHELSTNSFKYGTLSNAKGAVDISWRLEEANLHLLWREQGGPRPATTPSRRGFGTTLIEKSAQGEGGEAQMMVEEGGVVLGHTAAAEGHGREGRLLGAVTDKLPVASLQIQTKPTAAKLAGKRILVIEDEALLAMDIAMMLEDAEPNWSIR